jgi:transposase
MVMKKHNGMRPQDIIDLFVDSVSVKDPGFKSDFVENGRAAYHPSDLLKFFIYGYMNKTRSTRDMEKEYHRKIEVMWAGCSLHIIPGPASAGVIF